METKMEPVLNFTNEVIDDKKHKFRVNRNFCVEIALNKQLITKAQS